MYTDSDVKKSVVAAARVQLCMQLQSCSENVGKAALETRDLTAIQSDRHITLFAEDAHIQSTTMDTGTGMQDQKSAKQTPGKVENTKKY